MSTPPRSPSALNPLHPPRAVQALKAVTERINLSVKDPLDHQVPAVLHVRDDMVGGNGRGSDEGRGGGKSDGGVVLVSGAGEGVSGPGGIYPSLADKVATLLRLPTLRLDYRQPARNQYCVSDVLTSLDYLSERFSCSRFLLVGWSFGGAPCFTASARDGRVAGVATVASQTAETEGIKELSPRPVLLIHGTGDSCLSPRCSKMLYEMYGSEGGGDRELRLFEGDDHGLTRNAGEVERMIFEFAERKVFPGRKVEGEREGQRLKKENLTGDRRQRVETMKEGHDLDNEAL